MTTGTTNLEITNPADETTTSIETTPIESIKGIVEQAQNSYPVWQKKSVAERVDCLKQLSSLLENNKTELAQTISTDMGKPIAKAQGEVDGTIALANFLCDNATEWLAPEKLNEGHVHFDSLGVVAVIAPWNYPAYVPVVGIIPALLAGNSVVFKPSEYTLKTGILISQLINELDQLPENVFQIVVGGKEHGQALVDSDVQMVSFTGSTATGKKIMESCARDIKRVHLELGGLDAAIVLKDADIDTAAKRLVRNNCNNTGQVCCAVKRVYVEKDAYEDFIAAATKYSEQVTFGNPSENNHMGPLVAKFQRDKVADIVEDARTRGATIHTGGATPQSKGFFYPSTIVSNIKEDMRILNEEPFGPVLPVMPVDNWEEAVEKANSNEYGLTASVWTSDTDKLGQTIASQLDVGQVGINRHGGAPLGSPFGGAKQSGIGRTETKEGMRSYTNTKFVY